MTNEQESVFDREWREDAEKMPSNFKFDVFCAIVLILAVGYAVWQVWRIS